MKTIKLLILCLSISATSIAQNTQQDFPNTLEGQFKKIYKKSSSYQVYKVIKKDNFLVLQKNVLDSISALKKDAVKKQATINTQKVSILDLENRIKTLNGDLTTSLSKENNISLFGSQLNKATYNTILWGIIAALLASLILFIYKFNSSNSLTKEAKNSLLDVEQEFEQHRKKTLEKEQKLRRQLQDEINKQRGV